MSEREAFEAWYRAHYKLRDGNRVTNLGWDAWQAAWRASREQALGEAVEAVKETPTYDEYDPSRTFVAAIEALRDKCS